MHIHVCRHTLPDTYGHTHITHKRAHTSGRTHTRANTRGRIHVWEHTHHTQAGTHKWRDTYSHTHLTHTRANTLHTHNMHTHFTHKWEQGSSFRSIGFKAGALYSVGTVCVRMSQFSKFITQIVHDTPCFITLLLQIKKNIWKVRSYLINFRVIRKMVTLFFQTPELK